MINTRNFAMLSDGRQVTAIRLQNCHGEYADILNYGATIRALCVLDNKGQLGDVVLGSSEGENPEAGRFQGCVIGRCANRIAWGRFHLDKKDYQLVIPFPERSPHFLHGGKGNYSCKFFAWAPSEDGQSVSLTHYDQGEDGWECGVQVKITYTLTDDHELHIDYELTPDGTTLLSPTNHAYFNLNLPHDITSTQLTLYADTYAPKDALGMPNGRLLPVKDTPLDFVSGRSFGEGLRSPKCGDFASWKNYDDVYFLPGEGYRKIAQLWCPENGRLMEVFTDQSALILFTPNARGTVMNKGYQIDGFPAFCLETQYVPNAVNCPEYPSPVFRKGETMSGRTTYKFGIK